ncbi:FAD:protein FMN transferase [Streptomyces globisporus]|uniref:FAD:protein FMN transferase n=1 Tax=Streptomyces globisporus TaxID=1908 RepID=UPI0037A09AD6
MASVFTAHHDLAIATSGIAERTCHILHPGQGSPATTFASVTAIGADLTLADAFATAAFTRGDDAFDWRITVRLRGAGDPPGRPGTAGLRVPPIRPYAAPRGG